MKRIFLSLLVILWACPAFANKNINTTQLKVSGVSISGYVITDGVTATTDSVLQSGNVGFSTLILDVSGNIAVSYEVSADGSNWYTPYTTDGASLTSVGPVVSSVTANRWIILTAKLSPYLRFKFTSTGSSTVTAKLLWQEER